jgi:hypothetical protein
VATQLSFPSTKGGYLATHFFLFFLFSFCFL